MSNAVQKTESQLPQVADATGGSDILKADVLIPMVLLMQGLSDLVSEKKAVMGDIVRSTTGEKIGDENTTVEFIPLTFQNLWVIQELVGKKYEFRKIIPRMSVVRPEDVREETLRPLHEKQDDSLPWDFTHNGTQWKRVKLLNLFAILPRDIQAFNAELARAQETGEMPDIEKALTPVVIPFRSTGFKAAKKVITHFTKAQSMAQYGAKAYAYALPLTCHQEKNDQGTFYVYDVGSSRPVTKTELAEAAKWVSILSSQKVSVHNDEEVVGVAPSTPSEVGSTF